MLALMFKKSEKEKRELLDRIQILEKGKTNEDISHNLIFQDLDISLISELVLSAHCVQKSDSNS